MNVQCDQLISSYFDWLRGSFDAEQTTDGCIITTPFLLPDNDPIKIWVTVKALDDVLLSDKGAVHDYLYFGSHGMERIKQRDFIIESVEPRGVRWVDDELVISCTVDTFSECLQGIISTIGELTKVARLGPAKEPEVPFKLHVKNYLDKLDLRYRFEYFVPGEAINHRIDFVFNGANYRFLETVTATRPFRALEVCEKVAFKFLDLRKAGSEFLGIVAFDDSCDVWSSEALSVLENYSDVVVPWADSERLIELVQG